jgi:hypothetical protein
LPHNNLVHDAAVFLPIRHLSIVPPGLLCQREFLRFFLDSSRRLLTIIHDTHASRHAHGCEDDRSIVRMNIATDNKASVGVSESVSPSLLPV